VQRFLVRSDYLAAGRKGINRANAYRLRTYTRIRTTTFMGLGVDLHEAVHVPLTCVEKHIRAHCRDEYHPKALSGWRTRNSYRHPEISNHVFGLALDIDPTLNPCCGCVGNWATVERCAGLEAPEGEAPLGRHELPLCWIDAFERHGFYWLGHDPRLRDTMHFEYLAPPGAVSCP
jgi:hypothetical protein